MVAGAAIIRACRSRHRWYGYGLVGLMALAEIQGLYVHFTASRGSGARRAVEELSDRRSELVVVGLTRASVEYYLRQRGSSSSLRSFPAEYAKHPGNDNPELLKDLRALRRA